MNPNIFATWLQKQGHSTIIQENGLYWYQAGFRTLQSFPYHKCIQPSKKQLMELLIKNNSIALRYSTDIQERFGKVSYHVVYNKNCMDFQGLPKKVRHDVRAGLDYATVEPIPFSRLASDGWELRFQTLQRQCRVGAETERDWQTLCLSAEGLPGFEAWGAIHDGILVAAILVFSMNDCCSILFQQSATDHLKHGINNALAYVITNEALGRPGVTQIFYGLHSLDAPSSVDEFKFRMGYIAYPVRQRVVFHPLIAPLVRPASYHLLVRAMEHLPGKSVLAKAEGIIRFYLQGKLSLADQDWPDVLNEQKAHLIEFAESVESIVHIPAARQPSVL